MSSICMLLMPDIHLHYPPDQTSKISQNFLYKCRNMIGRNKFLVSEYNLDFWFFLYAHFRIQCTSKLLVRKITCVVIFISMHLHLNQKSVFLLYILSQIEKQKQSFQVPVHIYCHRIQSESGEVVWHVSWLQMSSIHSPLFHRRAPGERGLLPGSSIPFVTHINCQTRSLLLSWT